MGWLVRIIGLLMAAGVLSGCSAIKVVYTQSTQLTYWWLDGYLDFTRAQSTLVRDELGRLQQWHQRTQLGGYADLLQKAALLMPAQMAPEQVCSLLSEVRGKMDAVATQAEPAIIALALSLSAAQIQHLNRKYAKTNAQWREDWLDASIKIQANKRFDALLDRAETLYGSLTDTQKDLLRDDSANPRYDTRLGYVERLRRQQDTVQILQKIAQEQPKPEQASLWVQGLFARSWTSPDPVYRSYLDGLVEDGCTRFAQLHNTTNTAQRAFAVKRLRGYASDAQDLQAQASTVR